MKPFTQHKERVLACGTTVGGALEDLVQQYPAIAPVVFEGKGKLNPSLQVYLHQESIRYLNGLNTALETGDTLSLVPLTQLKGME